jgi:beta-mannosidase
MLLTAWNMISTPPSAAHLPASLDASAAEGNWIPFTAPGTVAGALRDAGQWSFEAQRDLDAEDWWFRCAFEADAVGGGPHVLRFGGLATLADVWLNDIAILSGDNMWRAHEVDVSDIVRGSNQLVLRCRSLGAELQRSRPRPRWRTMLVESQNLRWIRTSLLGRMPGWNPRAPVIGPWRPIEVLSGKGRKLSATLRTTVDGSDGTLHVRTRVIGDVSAQRARIRCGDAETPGVITVNGTHSSVEGTITIHDVRRWWPHTHGEPCTYPVTLSFDEGRAHETLELGRVGFRDLAVDRGHDGRGFGVRVNGEPVFMRGGCWAPIDIISPGATREQYADAVRQVCAAGFNAIRVSGVTAYESRAFYDACDAAGVMIWQDFMFANMDYPVGDDAFAENVRAEVRQFLERHAHHPALTVLCGGSEVAQQAAMLGLPKETWSGALYDELIPGECARAVPGVPYVSNSPSGGPLPFTSSEGVTHYYGVGAYRRPLEDSRRADVRFASECLGFSNVPDAIDARENADVINRPGWKARVPRDRGADWDFEDIRDHYLFTLFGVHAGQLRRADPERYLALSRVVSGEVMARTFAEWRTAGSHCRGAFVWMHRDVWPGAGWGIIDSSGNPKAAYWMLARACAPRAVLLTDEGVNGLAIHVTNEPDTPFAGAVTVALWRDTFCIADGSVPIAIPARTTTTLSADEVLGRFTDVTYAYRFGPPEHDLVAVQLRDEHGTVVSEAHHFPLGLPSATSDDIGMQAEVWRDGDHYTLDVRTRRTAVAAAIDVPGFTPSANYIHISAGSRAEVRLHARRAGAPFVSGTVRALNMSHAANVTLRESAPSDAAAASPPA